MQSNQPSQCKKVNVHINRVALGEVEPTSTVNRTTRVPQKPVSINQSIHSLCDTLCFNALLSTESNALANREEEKNAQKNQRLFNRLTFNQRRPRQAIDRLSVRVHDCERNQKWWKSAIYCATSKPKRTESGHADRSICNFMTWASCGWLRCRPTHGSFDSECIHV